MREMSKRKFRFLLGFMIFSFLFASGFVVWELTQHGLLPDVLEAKEVEGSVQNVTAANTITDLDTGLDTDTHADTNKDTNTAASAMAISSKGNREDTTTIPGDTTLVFAGDVLFTDSHISRYQKGDDSINRLLDSSLLRELKNADYAMVNEEFPFGSGGVKAKDKQFTFQVAPSHVKMLEDMGVDGVTLANNHILDYGKDSLLETLTTLDRAGIAHCGAGKDIDLAKEPILFSKNGTSFAIVAATRVIPEVSWNAGKNKPGVFTAYDSNPMVSQIQSLKAKNDVVIVFVHWGIERATTPEKYQRLMARQYIDAGADVVIGSHPHVLQGMEIYKGKPIAYSLGNFMFNTRAYDTGLFKLTVDPKGEIGMRMIPCRSVQGKVSIQPKKDWASYIAALQKISYHCTIARDGTVIEKE